MSVQYASVVLHEYFLFEGTLLPESNTEWNDIWDRQKVKSNSEKKCPIIQPGK